MEFQCSTFKLPQNFRSGNPVWTHLPVHRSRQVARWSYSALHLTLATLASPKTSALATLSGLTHRFIVVDRGPGGVPMLHIQNWLHPNNSALATLPCLTHRFIEVDRRLGGVPVLHIGRIRPKVHPQPGSMHHRLYV